MKLAWVGLAVAAVVVGCGSNNSSAPGAAPSSDASTDAVTCEGGCAVTGLTQSQWTWVDVPGAVCRNGSATGFAVNLGSATDKLMIFLEGGGACFNELTCAMTPEAFTASTASDWIKGSDVAATQPSAGILNRMDANNPVKDWSFVYIPYCTGDIHAGANPAGNLADAGVTGTQHFVGYTNVGFDLQRIVPTFPSLSQILLTGISAGGFGAAANYIQVSRAFGSTPVTLLDDSGPAMESPYFPTCLASQTTALWNLDQTALADCGSDCQGDPSTVFLDYAVHLGSAYPDRKLALIEATEDTTIAQFFGFGQNNCAQALDPIAGPEFTDGLIDLRQKLASEPNWGSFFFAGTDHTSLSDSPGGANFDTNSTTNANTSADLGDGGLEDGASIPADPDAGTILLTTWVANLVAGQVSNVGP